MKCPQKTCLWRGQLWLAGALRGTEIEAIFAEVPEAGDLNLVVNGVQKVGPVVGDPWKPSLEVQLGNLNVYGTTDAQTDRLEVEAAEGEHAILVNDGELRVGMNGEPSVTVEVLQGFAPSRSEMYVEPNGSEYIYEGDPGPGPGLEGLRVNGQEYRRDAEAPDPVAPTKCEATAPFAIDFRGEEDTPLLTLCDLGENDPIQGIESGGDLEILVLGERKVEAPPPGTTVARAAKMKNSRLGTLLQSTCRDSCGSTGILSTTWQRARKKLTTG